MNLNVREMTLDEAELVINYFHSSSPEYLEMLGVDPSRLPSRSVWLARFKDLYAAPAAQRAGLYVIWRLDDHAIGFSSCDKVVYGSHAHMHLHVVEPAQRQRGIGAECVRRSVDIYFETFALKQLFCEPNAYNVAPNRTLQKAGFKYLKTHKTVPGPLNTHQAVTRWVIAR